MGSAGLYCARQVVHVFQVIQVVQAVRMISLDDMHSEDIWFSRSKPSNYREKLRCHGCDIRTEDQKPQKGDDVKDYFRPKNFLLPSIATDWTIFNVRWRVAAAHINHRKTSLA